MERLMNRFMLLSEEQGNTTLTNRTLFDGIQILIGDSDHVPAPSKATAQAPDESVGQGSRMEMLSLHLERIIAKAAVQGDETLTKRICREKLKAALGLSTLDRTDIDFINKEIPRIVRITSLCVEFMENDSDADSDAAQPNGTVTASATAPTGARARRTCAAAAAAAAAAGGGGVSDGRSDGRAGPSAREHAGRAGAQAPRAGPDLRPGRAGAQAPRVPARRPGRRSGTAGRRGRARAPAQPARGPRPAEDSHRSLPPRARCQRAGPARARLGRAL
jgi:hypothetical protein